MFSLCLTLFSNLFFRSNMMKFIENGIKIRSSSTPIYLFGAKLAKNSELGNKVPILQELNI